jgi:hypothetical protein
MKVSISLSYRPLLDRIDRELQVVLAGHHHHRQLGVGLERGDDEVDPQAVRQLLIEQQQVEAARLEQVLGLAAAPRALHAEARVLKMHREHLGEGAVVFDQK